MRRFRFGVLLLLLAIAGVVVSAGFVLRGTAASTSTTASAGDDPLSTIDSLTSFLADPPDPFFAPMSSSTLAVESLSAGGVTWRQGRYTNTVGDICFATQVPGEGYGFNCLGPRADGPIAISSGTSDLHGGMTWVDAVVPVGKKVSSAHVVDSKCIAYSAQAKPDGTIVAFLPGVSAENAGAKPAPGVPTVRAVTTPPPRLDVTFDDGTVSQTPTVRGAANINCP